jgi:type IV secretion system protein VirB2
MNPELAPQPNAIGASVSWIADTLVGNLATTIAVIAIAAFGLLLLSGHVPKKRGAQLILGCFMIFGATSIASGLMNVLSDRSSPLPQPTSIPVAVTAPPPPPPPLEPYDPYAGAALPPRR